jgi:uncharacterized repeat protein (TIGR04138 family)
MPPDDQARYIRQLAARDGRYAPEGFYFIFDAFRYTQKWVREKVIPEMDPGADRGEGKEFHVSGRELLEGIRRIARQRWGRLAPRVFRQWGVCRTEDFGEIVFLLVEDPEMGWKRRDCDSREDFAGAYDLQAAFDTWEDAE